MRRNGKKDMIASAGREQSGDKNRLDFLFLLPFPTGGKRRPSPGNLPSFGSLSPDRTEIKRNGHPRRRTGRRRREDRRVWFSFSGLLSLAYRRDGKAEREDESEKTHLQTLFRDRKSEERGVPPVLGGGCPGKCRSLKTSGENVFSGDTIGRS